MLRVLPPTFKPVSRQIRFHSRVLKGAALRSFPTRFAAMWQNKLHVFCYLSYLTSGALSIQPKILIISVFYIKWNGPFWFGPTGIFGTSFEGGSLKFIRLLRVVFSSQQRLNRPAVNAVQWRHSLPENRVVILIGWLAKHSHNYV